METRGAAVARGGVRVRLWLIGVLLALPGAASAHAISDELTLGSTQTSPQNPRAGSISNLLTGLLELSDAFALKLEVSATHDRGTPSQTGTRTTGGGNILNFALGGDWLPSEQWILGGLAELSPRSVTYSDTVVYFEENSTGRLVEADAVLRTVTSSFGLSLFGGFMTTGDSNLESAVDGSVALTRFSTTQNVVTIETPRGQQVSAQTVMAYCSRAVTLSARLACAPLLAALRAQPASLAQLRFSLGVTETLFADTDVGLAATLYAYDRDPAEVGYFSVVAVGRTVSLGQGIPIAPLRFTLRPMVAHRFGDLWLDGTYQFGRYVGELGVNHTVSLRAQYRFGTAWRVWLRGGLQFDLAEGLSPLRSRSIGAGVRYSF